MFEQQPENSGACAIYSIMHALRLQGFEVTIDQAYRLVRLPRILLRFTGTDEHRIKGALRRFKQVDFIEYSVTTAKEFRKELDKRLAAGYTAIVCVMEYEHWAVIAGREGEKYVRIDSIPGWKIKDVVTWDTVRRWFEADGEYYGLFIKRKDVP